MTTVASVEVAIVRQNGGTCTSLTATGAFVSSPSCKSPASVLVAASKTHCCSTPEAVAQSAQIGRPGK